MKDDVGITNIGDGRAIRRYAPRKIFVSYSHEDERLRRRLLASLRPLEREGQILHWFDGKLAAGDDINAEIARQLKAADLFLCLVSPAFLASDYIYDEEMRQAIARHRNGELKVVPVILRPCMWEHTPLSCLRALPKDGKPITTWPNRDQAFLDVARALRSMLDALDQPTAA